jgi:multicomponent Na+:H+ antiporter subunit B
MLGKYPVLRVVTSFILPYISIFALYIQINGEISPGGGFQAGAILASAIIALSLTKTASVTEILHYLPVIAVLGVMLYAATGLISILLQHHYLDYSVFADDKLLAQAVAITIIEIGVGLTVFASMLLIYRLFDEAEE